MPFLAIFRKDKDRDSSRSKTPVPLSPAPPLTPAKKSSSFSRSRSRPSFASSRSCTSPPPQLANISPNSDFDYILPEIDAPSLLNGPTPSPAPKYEKELVIEESPVKQRRGLPFGRRRGSTSSGIVIANSATPPSASLTSMPRPFSEALDTFMTYKQGGERDRDLDRSELEAPARMPGNSNTEKSRNPDVSLNSTTTRHTQLEDLDSGDDDPLVPPPPRASVFAGYAYSDRDKLIRSQSLPDVDTESRGLDTAGSDTGVGRPPRPQVHPHQLARGKNKSVDLNSLLTFSAPSSTLSTPSVVGSDNGKMKRKDASSSTKTSGGIFGWRSKSSKEVSVAAAPTPIATADPAESSFSLKSFRHVGPASTSVPASPVAQPPSAFGSATNVNTAGINTVAAVSTPPSSYGRSSPALGARPIPGRTNAPRERVNSTGSEGVMTAGLFRQAARRSSTNLVDDVGTSPRSSVAGGMGMRDRERRGPPTRTWDVKDGNASSESDRAPMRPSRNVRPPESGASSDRGDLGVGNKGRQMGRSSSAMPYVGRNRTESPTSSPESPFSSALPRLGKESTLSRSGLEGASSQPDYNKYGARSDGGVRSSTAQPATSRPGPQPATNTRPGPQSSRSGSPTKPRQSAPSAGARSPMRTTIPTKKNDGPSIKPRASSPTKPSMSGHPRRSSVDASPNHSRFASVDTLRTKPPGPEPFKAKSPSVDMTRAKSPGPDTSRSKSPAAVPRTGYKPPPRQSSLMLPAGMDADSDEDESEPEGGSGSEELGFGTRPKSMADKLEAAEKERVGGTDSFGARVGGPGAGEVGAMRGRGSSAFSTPERSGSGSSSNTTGRQVRPPVHDSLSRERTITQRNAGSERASPVPNDPKPPIPQPRVGVSLFDRPMPSLTQSSSSSASESPHEKPRDSPMDKFGAPPTRGFSRSRASHSTSAIGAAATARNSASIAEANRARSGHSRGTSSASVLANRPSHIRAPATVEGSDTDEDDDDKSESDSEDNAPLSALAPARRPGSAASVAPSVTRTPATRARTQPLIDLASSGIAPPPRPPRRVPGVGVTRNSSLRGSRSVEDLGRMTVAPGSAAGGRPGPRPFAGSPPSSTGDSSSGKLPLTPRDGSEAGGRRVGSVLGPAGDEARRKQRRRSEAKASVELGNVINGSGPLDNDDDDGDHMSTHHSQLGHGGMGMMGFQPGMFPQSMGFPSSQSMPFVAPQFTGSQFPASQSMPFVPPPPPPGASEAYVMAHQQAMMMAKQAYLAAVAQQAMAAATEQWERSSNVGGGSVYGGSQAGMSMGMMGMPMMSMYANSSYAASAYEGSVVGGGGWGSASAYGGPSGTRSVYGGGARSEYGGGMRSEYGGARRSSPTKSPAGGRTLAIDSPARSRARAHTATANAPAPASRGNAVPPSTWKTRRGGGV